MVAPQGADDVQFEKVDERKEVLLRVGNVDEWLRAPRPVANRVLRHAQVVRRFEHAVGGNFPRAAPAIGISLSSPVHPSSPPGCMRRSRRPHRTANDPRIQSSARLYLSTPSLASAGILL